MYKDMIFAVAENRVENHVNTGNSWACRHYNNDSLDDEHCGSGRLTLEDNGSPNLNHPNFKRMVEYLKSKNIPIGIWNGKEIIPYKD